MEEDGAPDFVFQAGGFSVLETENGTMGLSDSDSISPLWTGDMDELASELYTAMKAKQEAIDISKYQFQYTESSSGADRKKLMQVYYAVVNDHPDLYYVRTAYSFTYSDGIIKKIKPQYFADMDDAAFMREGTDYEINSLIGTEAAGKASVNITGKGAYYGTTTKRFTITPHDINTNDVSVAFVKSGAQPYEKNGAKPKVRVVYKGNTLEESVDYTLSYKGNKSVGDTATVTIKGKRNFTGMGNYDNSTTTAVYRILPAGKDLSKASVPMAASRP